MNNIHFLKTWPEYFRAVVSGEKKVEIRSESDRSFKKDDLLVLKEWDNETKKYTGDELTLVVTHCLRGEPWLPKGYVALSISPLYVEG